MRHNMSVLIRLILFFRIITEKDQKILYKNPNMLLQIRKKDVIIHMYDSRNCERGGDASLSC